MEMCADTYFDMQELHVSVQYRQQLFLSLCTGKPGI